MFDTLDTTIQNPRSAWTTAASFSLQTFGVGVLLLIPLIYTDALPVLRNDKFQLLPPPHGRRETITKIISAEIQKSSTEFAEGRLIEPRRIPLTTKQIVDKVLGSGSESGPPSIGIPSGTGESQNAWMNAIVAVPDPPRPAPAPNVTSRTMRVSSLELGALVRKVEPVYPASARMARIQGPVKLHAVIDTAGRITSLQVLSGHPLLVSAAMDAVRQWRYRSYLLNGEPVPVETEITVNFNLN
ncbi:MAG TPA: energy transducer TonB [Candidatus Acidoferrales bacterium]|nr:energy transducer TonB [Candidatus Acidoferrales bacterium]